MDISHETGFLNIFSKSVSLLIALTRAQRAQKKRALEKSAPHGRSTSDEKMHFPL